MDTDSSSLAKKLAALLVTGFHPIAVLCTKFSLLLKILNRVAVEYSVCLFLEFTKI